MGDGRLKYTYWFDLPNGYKTYVQPYQRKSYQDNLGILKRKLYSQAKPLLLEFQTALYEQLYELKLILGGDTK